MLEDPYAPGSVPPYLAGRNVELARISAYLTPLRVRGEMPGPPMILTGPRGIGKTSLATAAREYARGEGIVVAWTSCSSEQPFLGDVAAAIARALDRTGNTPGRESWASMVQRLEVTVGVPAIAELGVAIERGNNPPAVPGGAITALEELLHVAANAAAGRESTRPPLPRRPGTSASSGLLVVIDELHAGAPGELAVLLNALQNLNHDAADTPLAVIGAGIPAVTGVITEAATFGERSRWLRLSELGSLELLDALVTPARQLGVTWDDAAAQDVIDASHGYPHFVQLLGSTTWSIAQPSTGATITPAHASAGIHAGLDEIDSVYSARWGALTPAERRLVTAIAHLGGEQPVARTRLEEALRIDISPMRSRLLDKAVIAPAGRGLLQLTLPGFAGYITRETDGTPLARQVTAARPDNA